MVSTLESTNLDTPITPANNKALGISNGSGDVLDTYTTPETDGEKTEDEPRTPQKESSKKKSNRIGSKRKLFLQSGPTSSQSKVKKMTNPAVAKPKKTATPVEASPTLKSSPGSSAGKEGAWPSYPLTERQQLQYLLEVTAKEAQKEPQESDSEEGQNFTRLKKKEAAKREANALRMSKRNERGETLLHLAAIKGDIEETIALIKAGVSVNMKDYAGWTPLHEACNFGHFNIVDELLKGGASVNAPGYEEISPLHDAVINNHVQVVELLLRHGADPVQTTMQGYTSIDLARSASILELLQSAQCSTATPFPKVYISSTNLEKIQDSDEPVIQVNSVQKESGFSPEKGYVLDQSQGGYNQASPEKFAFVRGSSFEQNLYSRRSSSSSASQISDIDDSIDPKRLNECLDKAMLEMSSYLDPKEDSCEFLNQEAQKSNCSSLGNSVGASITSRSKNVNNKKMCSQQNLENQQNMVTVNGQSNYVGVFQNEKENVVWEGEILALPSVSKNSMQIENDFQRQSDQQYLNSRSQILEVENSNKENHQSQIITTQSDINITNEVSSTKLDSQKPVEVHTGKAIHDYCVGHIKNPTWRKGIEKQYYCASSLPLFVPGYKKFLMNSKSYLLQSQEAANPSLSSRSENVEESELKRLKTTHQVEREKLRLCLEQEIVRLFGSFARQAIEKDIPVGVCTILQQQMKTHRREKSNPKKNVDKLSGQSIKADVEQILQKFEKLKDKLLNRQKHEIDAIIALQQLAQGKTGGSRPERAQQQENLKLKDFELMPAGFREYYEEFLNLID